MKPPVKRLIDIFFWILSWTVKILVLIAIIYLIWSWWEHSYRAEVIRGEY